MTSTNQAWSVREIVRHEQGARESQQDAVFAGDILFAIADGFGSGDTAARAAVDALAPLDQDPRIQIRLRPSSQRLLARAALIGRATTGRPSPRCGSPAATPSVRTSATAACIASARVESIG